MLVAIFIYSFFGILFSIYNLNYLRIPQLVAFSLFTFLIVDSLNYFLIIIKNNPYFLLFFCLSLFTTLRFSQLDLNEMRIVLFDSTHLLSYLLPLAVFLVFSLKRFNFFIKLLSLFSISFICLNIFLINKFPVNNFTDLFSISTLPPAGFILLIAKFVDKKYVFTSIAIILIVFFWGLLYGRRTVIFVSTLFIFFSFISNIFFNNKISSKLKLSSLFIFLFIIYIGYTIFLNNVDLNKFELFNRLDVDSRSDVFAYFSKDFNIRDIIIGRGIDGTYYHPINYWNFDNSESIEISRRSTIENGFLHIILKGGIVLLTLFLIIIIYAFYLGFFKSNNSFVKSLSFYLVISLVEMLTYGQPTFSVKFYLLWLIISFCFSSRLRKLSDDNIMGLIK